jgi:hypothetical protein
MEDLRADSFCPLRGNFPFAIQTQLDCLMSNHLPFLHCLAFLFTILGSPIASHSARNILPLSKSVQNRATALVRPHATE